MLLAHQCYSIPWTVQLKTLFKPMVFTIFIHPCEGLNLVLNVSFGTLLLSYCLSFCLEFSHNVFHLCFKRILKMGVEYCWKGVFCHPVQRLSSRNLICHRQSFHCC